MFELFNNPQAGRGEYITSHFMDTLGVVVNKKARNFASFNIYTDALSKSGLSFKLYKTDPEKLDALLKKCVKDHPILLVGGGDGTIRCAAQLCVNTSTILGVLPLGTMNHFAKELSLPGKAEEIVQAIIKKTTINIDTAEVNGWVFVNNSSLGFYPRFAEKRACYTRFYNKWLSYLPSFIETLQRHETYTIHIKNKKINLSLKTSFLMLSNNLYSYTFPLTFERESFNKAQLGIYFFKHGKLQLSKIIKYWFNRKNNFEIKSCSLPVEISVTDHKKVTISLDGETIVTVTPLMYKILPQSLTLLTN